MTLERLNVRKALAHATPGAQAYWHEVNARPKPDPVPDFDTPTCQTCGGYGYVRYDVPVSDARFGKLHACPNPDCPTLAQRRDQRYVKLCTLSQLPSEYLRDEVTFAGWAALAQYAEWIDGKREALGAALAFVNARDNGFMFSLNDAAAYAGVDAPSDPRISSGRAKCSLVFTGRNGVGKTSLAVSAARYLLDARVPVVYLRLAEFFDGLKERFKPKASYEYGGDEADDEAEYMRQYQQAPVLIIDEFFSEVTPWRKERAEALINYRYTHQLPTVMTTNRSADELSEIWGLTTGHRLQAMAHWVAVGGQELRPRAKTWGGTS